MTLHDLTPLQFPQFHPPRAALGYRLLLRRALAQADAVVVDSDAVRAEVVAVAPAVAPRVTTIPLGVGAHFRPGRRTPDFSRRLGLPDRYVLSVGVLEPRKNHGALVSALARLHAAGERISLVLAGRTGWRWRDPLEAPGLSALRPWVRVIRNVSEDDLVELYGRAAVLAYPSFAEGFGLPLLEAMACGCPVVASTRGSLPEVGGDAAVYAPPEDVEALAAQLLALLRDEGHRRLHVERGRVRAAGFTWRRTAERMLAVYRAIAPDAHRSSPGVA
jgi:alpha-1,3-rhamnosyl/mannosyltransferase